MGWLRAGWVMGPVLVAAGALWMLGGPPQSALPAYELEVRGGNRVTRGAEETPAEARLSAGSRLDLVVRPETDVEGPLQAAAFRLEGGAWVDAGLAVHVDPSGAVRASGTVGAKMRATPGPLRLAVVVTRGAGAPDPAWSKAARQRRGGPHDLRGDRRPLSAARRAPVRSTSGGPSRGCYAGAMSWLVYILLLGCSPSVPPTPPDPRTLRGGGAGGCAGSVSGVPAPTTARSLCGRTGSSHPQRSGVGARALGARGRRLRRDGGGARERARGGARDRAVSEIPLRAEVVSPTLAADPRDTKAPAWEGRARSSWSTPTRSPGRMFGELAHRADLARDLPLGASYAAEARAALVEAGRLGHLWPHVAFRYAARRVSVERWLPEVRAQIDDARRHLTPWWDDWAYLAFVEARLLRREGDVRRSASPWRERRPGRSGDQSAHGRAVTR